jgi:hypothetical protein
MNQAKADTFIFHLAEPNAEGDEVIYEVTTFIHPLAAEALREGVKEAWQAAIAGCRALIRRHHDLERTA